MGKYLTVDYLNSRQKLTWQCQDGHTWSMSIDGFKKGQWCPACLTVQKQHALQILQKIANKQGVTVNKNWRHS